MSRDQKLKEAWEQILKMIINIYLCKFNEYENEQIQYQRDLRTWGLKKSILEDELKRALKSKKKQK